MNRPPLPSLRRRLLQHILIPLSLTWMLGTGVTLGVAQHFTQTAFDRALLDDAYLIASHVHASHDATGLARLSFTLTSNEITAILFDQSETLWFAIVQPDGTRIAGHPDIDLHSTTTADNPSFTDITHRSQTLRRVQLKRETPAPFAVIVAQTTTSRVRLMRRLLLYSLAPQSLLLGFLAWALRRFIQADLEPLATLQGALQQRDSRDLSPVNLKPPTRDLQALAHTINHMLGRIALSIQSQREFSGNVAHELRTPLAGIRAQADYALSQPDPKIWREQLAGIAQSQERASHIIDQLLALARAHEAQQAPVLTILPLDEIVQEVLIRFMPRADALGFDLGAQGLESPSWVWGDQALIEGLLNNLLDNALRYGRPAHHGSARVTVIISRAPSTPPGQIHLTVQDHGPGISWDQRQLVLQRWSQGLENAPLQQGCGLGLAIVSEYARLLKGHLSLNPGPSGIGLTVTISLQAAPPEHTIASHHAPLGGTA